MTSKSRADRLVDEFNEGAAAHNGQVRFGIAAVLRHLIDTEGFAVEGAGKLVGCPSLKNIADALSAPSLLDRALSGDPQAAREFLQSAGILDANGKLMPQYQSLEG